MKSLTFLPLLLLAALAGCRQGPGTVAVGEPWILEAPAGSRAMAGYGVVHNGTDGPVVIRRIESPAFDRVELHETRVENGQARMAPVDSLTLPAGGRAVMHPGGLHLMLMAPGATLKVGESAEIRFHLDNGDTLSARFPVRAAPPAEE